MKTEEQILNVLSTQAFADWFTEDRRGNFDRWIQGDPDAPTKEEILEDIRRFFQIDNFNPYMLTEPFPTEKIKSARSKP